MKPQFRIIISAIIVIIIVQIYMMSRSTFKDKTSTRDGWVIDWITNPLKETDWIIKAGENCKNAPFIFPTTGFVGYLWDDSFRPGHRHTGLDIFSPDKPGQTPVIAAYGGYLTRFKDWKSTVIIRIPQDPLNPNRQIWTYYTHMADSAGNSFISPEFPPGSSEIFVKAGTLLGYQGNYSGDISNPTGLHLHFSIVMDDNKGGFRNETIISNTIDPSPYFNMNLNANSNQNEIPICR